MKVVIAPQEFKGTLTAREAARAMAVAVRRVLPASVQVLRPMADGGPGTLDTLLAALGGARKRRRVTGPNGEPVEATWTVLPDGCAVIEMAQAAGLLRIKGPQRPMTATTRGVGELIRAALDAGCRSILVGVGGSATSDAGAGMARALGVRFLDAAGKDLAEGGGALSRLARVDTTGLDGRLEAVEMTVLCDVDNPLTGDRGAARVFGPQKGASPDQVRQLDQGFTRLAALVADRRLAVLPGAGAAGGLGFGLAAFCGARLEPGAAAVADTVNLDRLLRDADLCLTGEGRLDGQTAGGKTVLEVARRARRAGVPTIVVAGRLGSGWEGVGKAFALVATIVDTPAAASCGPARGLRLATEHALRRWSAVP